jgi:hypothetical protein
MSKYINIEQFKKFLEQKSAEKQERFSRSNVWPTPEKGEHDKPRIYEGRFLPDKKGNFYKRFYYHMWQSGLEWNFFLCPKTHDWKNACPVCTKAYETKSSLINRKERFVGNFYVNQDTRDEAKHQGKVLLYEFPAKLEKIINNEINSSDGYGLSCFDPGKDGRNFIIKVSATKKDKNGKSWPDYSNSMFSRKTSPIGSEEKIKSIMESTYDLDEYLLSLQAKSKKILEDE